MNEIHNSSAPRWGYALLVRLHFYAGLFVGPFIFVAALSGALFALTPQIENWLYHSELTTETTGTAKPLADQILTARSHIGDAATLAAVRPAPEPGETTRVMFAVDGLQPFEHQAVFVDPVSLDVRGELVVYGTSGTLPFRIWIDYVHRHLHLGEVGRYYSELAASWLWLVALGGLALWWRRRRSNLTPQVATERGTLRQWHSGMGVVLLLAFLFFSVTGLTWSKWAGANIAELRAQLDWGTPGLNTELIGSTPQQHQHGAHAGHGMSPVITAGEDNAAAYDAVLQQARAAGIDAGMVEIKPATNVSRAWVVREIDRSWPTQVDMVAVDARTLTITDRVDFETFPLAAKLTRWGIDAHMGILFGLANQLFVAACALGLCVMIVLGYRMWWLRRPIRSDQQRHRPQRVWTELKKAPAMALVVTTFVALGLGLFAPVMGVSLAVFLALDAALALRDSRRLKVP